jgi:hypothetical protein
MPGMYWLLQSSVPSLMRMWSIRKVHRSRTLGQEEANYREQ